MGLVFGDKIESGVVVFINYNFDVYVIVVKDFYEWFCVIVDEEE